MSSGRRSLRLDDSDGHDEETPWPAFGDIALALLLVFTLFILAQFLHYDQIFVLERLRARQDTVRMSVMNAVAPNEGVVTVDSIDAYHQRLTFQAELLFASCGTDPTTQGAGLMRAIGSALRPHRSFFEAVQVEGHTDVRRPVSCPVEDNWALSSGRATAIVRILAEPDVFGSEALLSAVGRGQYHPVSRPDPTPTMSAGELARDRRIELLLQYTDEGILEE